METKCSAEWNGARPLMVELAQSQWVRIKLSMDLVVPAGAAFVAGAPASASRRGLVVKG